MKVLYAIQGTGNGHLSRARDIIPLLKKYCDLDLLVSGTQSQVQLPYEIKFQYKGFSFAYNQRGGIHYGKSAFNNFSFRLIKEILQVPIKDYDLIINDFEPVSAWAARLRNVPCIALGHQAAFQSALTPRPRRRHLFGEFVLRNYAPANQAIGFHFLSYDHFIFPPVIRGDIRHSQPENKGHYTVYLPAIRDEVLIRLLSQIMHVNWQVFSRYAKESYWERNVWVRPIANTSFVNSLVSCEGIFTGAGFESPAEAIYLGKKLFVVPIMGQYEQQCNAAALAKLGVPIAQRVNQTIIPKLKTWVEEDQHIEMDFPDQTEEIIAGIFSGKDSLIKKKAIHAMV
ncbi:MAG: glycosyl transferase [Bacteroidetes bacterium]|nr:glycosyl transferase [Bacteroidota bacterium]MCB0842669.1 glycosyl transferase [Bacteroidota bacterium]